MSEPSVPPALCAIGFKEWAGVCDALAEGRQSLILRKGGVSEGPNGFLPEHPAFWLYPTHVHEAEQGLRNPAPIRHQPTADAVAVEALAVVEWVGRVEQVERLADLAPFHEWTEATTLTRFHYRRPGLWALAVRVHLRPEPCLIPVTTTHLGCKTWVPLEDPPSTAGLVAVLDDGRSAERLEQLRETLRITLPDIASGAPVPRDG